MNDVPPGRVGGSRAPPARLPLVYGASEPARTGAAFVLGHCGMRVLTADSAQGALQILDRELVDVIVSDIRLSGEGDGFELIRAVRAHPEPYGRVPAIVVSAHANSDDQARALAAGYELHVAKPVEPSELVAAVASVLRSRTAPSTQEGGDQGTED